MSVMNSSLVCVDASLVVRFLVPGPFRLETKALFAVWEQAGTRLLAPGLFEYEVVASLRRMVHQKVLLPAEGEVAFAGFERINVSLVHDRSLHTLAWQLAKHFKQSRTYDMTYLAVAQLNDCAFWTADERLYNSVRHELAWVNWIGTSAPKS